MKKLVTVTVTTLLSSAMFFVVVCAGADPGVKPTHGKSTGTIYMVGPCTDTAFPLGAVQNINIGKGVFTHTGKSGFFSSSCTYFISQTSAEGFGWAIVTAENGDTIHLSIESTVDFSVTPPRWTEHETIIGGTGKFEGATGESDSGGTWTLGTDPFPYNLNGSPDEIPPLLLQPPQGWEGTTNGWISK
jgi:hypothetical protein